MQSILVQLSDAVGAAFATLSLPETLGQVIRSDRPDLAPYQCNGCMSAAKLAKTNPRQIATQIAKLLENHPLIKSVEVAGPGFLNLEPASDLLAKQANLLINDPHFGAVPSANPQKIVLDFGGPNVAKPMHVGHLRSSVIGDCLQRLFRFLGHDVTSDIHLGDWGLQMGQLITELQLEQPELVYFDAGNTGPWPEISPVTIDDLSRMYPAAALACKTDPARLGVARSATTELQAGRAGYRALLGHFIAVSRVALQRDFDRLGVHFDLWKGESDVDPLIAGMIEQFKSQGIPEQSEGALVIHIALATDTKDIAPLILLSSAGAALYGTTDLATLLDRKTNLQPDLVLYVVDQRQAEHFEQVFRAADRTGLFKREQLEHIGFGTVNGPDGKPFKTRAGGVMRLADLMNMAEAAAEARMLEAGIAADFDSSERADIVRKIALAAIKFADLRNVRTTNYMFDLERFTSFEGKTGPYLLYAAVRMKSVLRKAAQQNVQAGVITPTADEEIALVLTLDSFDHAVQGAFAKRAPHILCEHLYDLAQVFSRFYTNCKVLVGDDQTIIASRVALVAVTLRQLETGLQILGIETPQRM